MGSLFVCVCAYSSSTTKSRIKCRTKTAFTLEKTYIFDVFRIPHIAVFNNYKIDKIQGMLQFHLTQRQKLTRC